MWVQPVKLHQLAIQDVAPAEPATSPKSRRSLLGQRPPGIACVVSWTNPLETRSSPVRVSGREWTRTGVGRDVNQKVQPRPICREWRTDMQRIAQNHWINRKTIGARLIVLDLSRHRWPTLEPRRRSGSARRRTAGGRRLPCQIRCCRCSPRPARPRSPSYSAPCAASPRPNEFCRGCFARSTCGHRRIPARRRW